jgi:hypothetical protein
MVHDRSKFQKFFSSLLIGGGIALGGYFIGKGVGAGLMNFRINSQHTVEVKGISERQLKSDFAVWKISFRAEGETFQESRGRFYASRKTLLDFLKEGGFEAEEISEEVPSSTIEHGGDANYKAHSKNEKVSSYYFLGSFLVRTSKVDQVTKHAPGLLRLSEKGVMLGSRWGTQSSEIRYSIRNFDALRPELLEEAVKSARNMAEKFAEHSHAKVGAMLRAAQGTFTIEGMDGSRNGEASVMKKIRLVNHVTYSLDN